METLRHDLVKVIKDSIPYNTRYFINFGRLDQVLNLIKLYSKKQSRVLNLASGPGAIDFLLEKEGHEIVALDSNMDFKRVYCEYQKKEILKNTEFVLGSINYLPFKENQTFDLVLLNDCLSVPSLDLYVIIRELKEIIKKNGILIFDIADQKFLNIFRPIYEILLPQALLRKHYAIPTVIECLKQNGFTLEKIVPTIERTAKTTEGWKRSFWIPLFIIWKLLRLSNAFYIIARKRFELLSKSDELKHLSN